MASQKMKAPSPEVREVACGVYSIKFPRQERDNIKRGLTVFSLELFINGEVWDEWGYEVATHMIFTRRQKIKLSVVNKNNDSFTDIDSLLTNKSNI